MKNLPEITCGKQAYRANEGGGAWVESRTGVTAAQHRAYADSLQQDDWRNRGTHRFGENEFTEFEKDGDAVYLSYFPALSEMRTVAEENSAYLRYTDAPGRAVTSCTMTQISLEDFGLSYVVRLEDGRFIVFDGGWDFEPDADSLMRTLKTQSEERPIRVAAWIMTHPHLDHYRCFAVMWEKYAASTPITVEKFIYNFPDPDDTENVPEMARDDDVRFIKKMQACIAETGADVYKAHTGQVYEIGDVRMEVLSSPDDVFIVPVTNTNPFSLVIRMSIAGQTILWCADSSFGSTKIAERYGTYLKADILQVPHHGFGGGTERGYALIDPVTCFASSFERDYFETMNIYMPHNRFLLYNLHVEEFFCGGRGDITVELPYTPRPNGRKLYLDRIDEVQRGIGAKSWFFTDITAESCVFSIVNATATSITVYADLIFEESKDYVDSIKIIAPPRTVRKYRLNDPADADPDALFFNRVSLAKKGIPEGSTFTVRLRAQYPVVITGPHAPAYQH